MLFFYCTNEEKKQFTNFEILVQKQTTHAWTIRSQHSYWGKKYMGDRKIFNFNLEV